MDLGLSSLITFIPQLGLVIPWDPPGPGSRIPGPGSRIPGPGSRIPDPAPVLTEQVLSGVRHVRGKTIVQVFDQRCPIRCARQNNRQSFDERCRMHSEGPIYRQLFV